jgi:hypothetical protein
MKREALAFFRILPAGAADVGEDVSREDLRAAGLGDWSMHDLSSDDLSDVLPPLGPDYDTPLLLDDKPPRPDEEVIYLDLETAS